MSQYRPRLCMEVVATRDGRTEFCGKQVNPDETRCAEHGGTPLHLRRGKRIKPTTKPPRTK